MYLKRRVWIALGILCLVGAILFFRFERKQPFRVTTASKTNPVPLLSLQAKRGSSTAANPNQPAASPDVSGKDTNAPFPYRISNTTRKIDEVVRSDSAILLRHALIDSASGAPLGIPAHLRSQGDPGSYIVQARGTITEEFRARLIGFGAKVVAYIPNNAYLVRVNGGVADQL